MKAFSSQIGTMDETKVRVFSQSLVSMGTTLNSAVVAAQNPAAVQVIKDVSETITTAHAATAVAASPVERIITAISEAATGGGGTTGGGGGRGRVLEGPFNITFQIGKEKVGKIVANYIRDNELIKAEFGARA